jgi:hypothetical protein
MHLSSPYQDLRLPFDMLRMRGSMVRYVYCEFFFALRAKKNSPKAKIRVLA